MAASILILDGKGGSQDHILPLISYRLVLSPTTGAFNKTEARSVLDTIKSVMNTASILLSDINFKWYPGQEEEEVGRFLSIGGYSNLYTVITVDEGTFTIKGRCWTQSWVAWQRMFSPMQS